MAKKDVVSGPTHLPILKACPALGARPHYQAKGSWPKVLYVKILTLLSEGWGNGGLLMPRLSCS